MMNRDSRRLIVKVGSKVRLTTYKERDSDKDRVFASPLMVTSFDPFLS
jgi:hypothetical protein